MDRADTECEVRPTGVRLRFRHPQALRAAGLAAAVTALVFAVACAWLGIFPFGDRGLSWADGPIQYVGYFGWLHRVLTGEANLEYSFAGALGAEMFPVFAYYLSSPFSLLAAFFDVGDALRLVSVLQPLKLMCASATCAYYLTRRFTLGLPATLALAVSYALAPWMLIDGSCIMWLDGIYLLPVICLGIWKLVRGEAPTTLYLGIGLSVVFNWYAGYMCCAFAVLMFLVELAAGWRPRPAGREGDATKLGVAAHRAVASGDGPAEGTVTGTATGADRAKEGQQTSPARETVGSTADAAAGAPSLLRLCLRFACALGLGAALGAVMLVPTMRFMAANPVLAESSGLSFILSTPIADWVLMDPAELLASLALDGPGFAALGNVFVELSVLPASAVPCLLLAGLCALPLDRARLREKLAWFVGTLCLLACMALLPLNLALTGFSLTESYHPRFMFLIFMALVHCAALALTGAGPSAEGDEPVPEGTDEGLTQAVANEGPDHAAKGATEPRQASKLPVTTPKTTAVWVPSRAWARTAVSGAAGAAVILLLPIVFYPELVVSLPARIGELACAAALLALLACGVSARAKLPSRVGATATVVAALVVALPCLDFSSQLSLSARDAYFSAIGDTLTSGTDEGFFRAESCDLGSVAAGLDTLTENATTSDHLAMGVNGLAFYSSTSYPAVGKLLGKMGYCYTPSARNMTWYRAPLAATDALFGLRSVLAPYAPAGMRQVEELDLPAPYGPGWAVYGSDRALPLGFGVAGAEAAINWDEMSWWNWDAFKNQSALFASLVGHEVELYTEGGEEAVVPLDDALSDRPVKSAHWLVTAPADGPLYLAQYTPPGAAVMLAADGVPLETTGTWAFGTNVVYLGEHAAGDLVELSCTVVPSYDAQLVAGAGELEYNLVATEARFAAATLDLDALDGALDELRARPFEASRVRDGLVEGRYRSDGEGKLLFTIPYDVGWRIEVDGVPTEAESLDGLIALELAEGEHKISLRYLTPGLRLGMAGTAASLAAFCIWQLIVRRSQPHERRHPRARPRLRQQPSRRAGA